MSSSDLQAFLRERATAWDDTLDVTPGSPYDAQVIQPILRRLGTDPFAVDLGVFIQERINQEFPELATKEGDALTDLLLKTAIVLFDPIVRENFRVKQNLSFKDPTTLTLEESEALGANLFAERNTGDRSRVQGRIYFAQPQQVSISPANFVTSRSGLHFLPTENQSISVNEMLFNLEDNLYYFDINLIAEKAGDEYNISAGELVSIANIASATKVTNKLRARFGVPEETAVEFVDRVKQDLTERSLVTERGITAKIAASFPDVTRLAVTGFNDPEMQRDVLRGGGLGPIRAGGIALNALADGENGLLTRRLQIDTSTDLGVNFTSLIGPTGQAAVGFTITIHEGFPVGDLPVVRDLKVRTVVSADTLDLEEQVLDYLATDCTWTLRKSELTLSGIPGGIIFPDSPAGTISVPSDEVHIGGTTDIYLRGTDFDGAALVIDDLVDDEPELQGIALQPVDSLGSCELQDLTLGTNYSVGDSTYEQLERSVGLTVQIRDVPIAGSYRILSILQGVGQHPIVQLTPAPLFIVGAFRWRLFDTIDVDLADPRETKVEGSDMVSVQGVDVLDTIGGTDFDTYGVGTGDIVRIHTGALVIGDYTVKQVLTPLYTRIQVDRPLAATLSNLSYSIFRPNKEGGIELPLVRVSSIDLLDTSSQPVGSKVPYARPVDIRSRSFANAAHGIKAEVYDATLGLVSAFFAGGTIGTDVNGLTLVFVYGPSGGSTFTVMFTGATTTIASVISQINTQYGGRIAVQLSGSIAGTIGFGILPIAENTKITSGTATTALFAGRGHSPYTSRDIRSVTENTAGGWDVLRPHLDAVFDVAQVVDGLQIGFYDGISTSGSFTDTALVVAHDFSPEIQRHVQVGSRSLGSARCYFLEPTSIEFGLGSSFTFVGDDGSIVKFVPDPTLAYQRVPALPSGVKPKDGVSTGSDHFFTTSSVDFIQKGIMAGDLLVIDYVPLAGSALADPVVGLALTTIRISVNNGVDKIIVFVHDSNAIPTTDVTRAGVAEQINRVVGQNICKINAANALEFEADASIVVRGSGTANTLLGFSLSDTNNNSPAAGRYTISSVSAAMQLNLGLSVTLSAATRQQFKVFRSGIQRICSTQMSSQVAETGLYYFDVELLSQGTGDQYNIDAGKQLTSVGYASDGYWLTTEDSNLSFSVAERPHIHFSRSLLEVGTTDDPDNATQLSGQNIQLNYDRSSIVNTIQNFTLSETERVINESPLSRHLTPYFTRLDLTYVGGSREAEVLPVVEKFIRGLFPKDFLEVSDLEKILSNKGATSITNPVNLIAVIHNPDRSITSERSQDKINTGRLAAFIPDVIRLTRNIA